MRPGPKGRNPERMPSADARSALRATADLRPKSRLRRLASETRSADRSRGRSAPRPRLESASRTRPCGPDSLSGWPAANSPATPAPPPVGLRPKSAAPCHGSADGCTASRQPPRRGRNASARESPEPYRKCARGGTAAFAWRAAPTGRRKTARIRRARAQGARTPGTGVVFRRVSPASHPTAGLLGAAVPAFYSRLAGRERWGDSQGGRALRPASLQKIPP